MKGKASAASRQGLEQGAQASSSAWHLGICARRAVAPADGEKAAFYLQCYLPCLLGGLEASGKTPRLEILLSGYECGSWLGSSIFQQPALLALLAKDLSRLDLSCLRQYFGDREAGLDDMLRFHLSNAEMRLRQEQARGERKAVPDLDYNRSSTHE
ncbi:hypothetical protein WJX72_000979 [[Myrmecia] bisecta]|uniref:Uncharacterized protein n=1 Tax=[Myrmecia] bisecta TaxID=41462 RepID=A0AAW1QP59_9CHLO